MSEIFWKCCLKYMSLILREIHCKCKMSWLNAKEMHIVLEHGISFKCNIKNAILNERKTGLERI